MSVTLGAALTEYANLDDVKAALAANPQLSEFAEESDYFFAKDAGSGARVAVGRKRGAVAPSSLPDSQAGLAAALAGLFNAPSPAPVSDTAARVQWWPWAVGLAAFAAMTWWKR